MLTFVISKKGVYIYYTQKILERIEDIEKHLPPKRKVILHCLRANDWNVFEVSDEGTDWALDQKWLIESTRQNKGATLVLWWFEYNGEYDGMDRVVATLPDASVPSPYAGGDDLVSLDLDSGRFQQTLKLFMTSLHELRINGVLGGC